MTPLTISVITVCYNSDKTLRRTLESVAQQDWPRVEHIVVDGGSADNTAEILKEFHSQLASVISEPDNGIYDAMNKGVLLAKGDIIGILNSDDIFSCPTVLSSVARLFQDDKVDAIFGDLQYFRADASQKTVRTYRSKNFMPSKLSMGLMPAHPTLFLRKRVYEKYGIFNPSYKLAGDFEFISRIFRDGELNYLYLPEVMVRMQLGGASTAGLISNIKIFQEKFRACKENAISSNYLKLMSYYPQKILEYIFH